MGTMRIDLSGGGVIYSVAELIVDRQTYEAFLTIEINCEVANIKALKLRLNLVGEQLKLINEGWRKKIPVMYQDAFYEDGSTMERRLRSEMSSIAFAIAQGEQRIKRMDNMFGPK